MPNKMIEDGRVPRVVGVDKRMKLTPEQRAEIRENKDGLSLNALASLFGVSKRSVHFIRRPDAHRENLLRRQERGGSARYYDHEKHALRMAEHREHKKQLFEEGLLEVREGEHSLAHKCANGALKMTYSDPQRPTAGR